MLSQGAAKVVKLHRQPVEVEGLIVLVPTPERIAGSSQLRQQRNGWPALLDGDKQHLLRIAKAARLAREVQVMRNEVLA